MTDAAMCLGCDGKNPFKWMVTHLDPAATYYVCEPDYEQWLTAMLATRLEVPAGWLTEMVLGAVQLLKDGELDPEQVQLSEDQAAEGAPQNNDLYLEAGGDE